MTLQTLLFLVNTLKKIQIELRTKDLLNGLTLIYELSDVDHLSIQKEIYKLSHPAMENFEEKDVFAVELLDTKFVFSKLK